MLIWTPLQDRTILTIDDSSDINTHTLNKIYASQRIRVAVHEES